MEMAALRALGLVSSAMIGALLVLGILHSVRGQDPPASVVVEMRPFDNGTVQFICVEDSNPPATHFTWKRMDKFDFEAAVILGNGRSYSGENLPNGYYICEVTNPIGTSSGYLYFYRDPGSSDCLHACLWPWLSLFLALGVCIYWRPLGTR